MLTQPTDLFFEPAVAPDVSLPALTNDGMPMILMLPDDVLGVFRVLYGSKFVFNMVAMFLICDVLNNHCTSAPRGRADVFESRRCSRAGKNL